MGVLEGNGGSGIFVQATNKTHNSATVKVAGLGQNAENYDSFRVYYQTGSTSSNGWDYVTLWNSNSGTTETSTITINGLTPSTVVNFVAGANFRGTWYYGGVSPLTLPSAPTPSTPSLSLNEVNGKVIKVNVTTGGNTSSVYFDHYVTMPWGSRYQTVNIGSNTTYTYTFTVPEYTTQYKVDAQAKSSDGVSSSWSPALTFNSGQMMPQIEEVTITNVSGKTATYRIKANLMGEMADLDYSWVSGYPDAEVYLTTNGYKFIDVTAPEYGKQYGVDFQAKTLEGIKATNWTGFQYFWTSPENVSNFRDTARGKNDITMAWNSAQGAVAYRIKALDNVTGVEKFYIRTTNLSTVANGLESGKFYKLQIWSENGNGTLSAVTERVVATRESQPPEIYMEVPTGNTETITVVARGVDRLSGINYVRVHVSHANSTAGWSFITKYPQNIMETENLSFVFLNDGNGSKFQVNQTYYFKAEAMDNDGNSTFTGNFSFTPKNARPQNFSWNVSWGSGSTFDLKASQWNKFTQSINDFRVYKGKAIISFGTVTTGQTFTATQYNQARNAINEMNSSGIPSTVSTGDKVLASHLNQLANVLNAIT